MPWKRMFVKQKRKSFELILTQSTYMKDETRLAKKALPEMNSVLNSQEMYHVF